MKFLKQLGQVVTLCAAMVVAQVAHAAPKTLIEMAGGKPKAGLAKSWTKVKAGEYEFVLDTSQELKKGTPVSAAAVKGSLESKMGTTHGVKVADKGGGKISVTYTGDENKFLDEVSKTKIREKSVEIAMESSVSEGGIRANPGNRPPEKDEVKGSIMKVDGSVVTVKVNESKSDKVKAGTAKVKTDMKGLKTNQVVFFIPEKDEGGVWTPKAGSFKDK